MPYDPHAERDMQGYGPKIPQAQWPNNARVCVSFVINYEEGGENTLVNGDPAAENYLSEYGAPNAPSKPGLRNLPVESSYAYGARRGIWRLLELFQEYDFPFTSWAVARAVELNPQVVGAMEAAKGEVGSHSYRWINHVEVPEEEEREHIAKSIDIIHDASPSNSYPLGWYTGRQSANTRRLVYEEYKRRGLHHKLYDCDAYDEDVPYYVPAPDGTPNEHLLVVPYTLDVNDMKFGITPGFFNADSFYQYMRDALDTLIREGDEAPRMMTVGLHCRVVGRPGRIGALRKFFDYIKEKDAEMKKTGAGIWVTTRGEIAEHWRKVHPVEK